MINYYTIRIIIMSLVLVIIALVYKYLIKEKNKKNQRIMIIIALLFHITIGVIPLEKLIKFNTVNGIFKYYHPKGKIIKIYKYDDYAYIYYSEKGKTNFIYYINRGKWMMDNSFYRGQGSVQRYDYCTIYTNRIIKKDITGIAIDCLNDKNVITDSLSTVFDELKYNEYSYIRVAIINMELDNNYILNINDKEYKPFE